MTEASALGALVLAAQLAGVQTAAPPPSRPAAVRPAPPPGAKPILTLTLQEITRDQERAFASERVGQGIISFSLGLDPKADLWIKLRLVFNNQTPYT